MMFQQICEYLDSKGISYEVLENNSIYIDDIMHIWAVPSDHRISMHIFGIGFWNVYFDEWTKFDEIIESFCKRV